MVVGASPVRGMEIQMTDFLTAAQVDDLIEAYFAELEAADEADRIAAQLVQEG
jgi:hypothetical protein